MTEATETRRIFTFTTSHALNASLNQHFMNTLRYPTGGGYAASKKSCHCRLAVDGDAGEGDHDAAAHGNAEGAGGLEDAAQ